MTGTGLFETVTGISTVMIAIAAWRVSVEAIRSTYRPVLRPLGLKIIATGYLHPTEILVKNIGNGPAVGVQVFNYPGFTDDEALGTLDALAPEAQMASITRDTPIHQRPGLISLKSADVDLDPEPGKTYRILYQDIAGNWHESQATYGKDDLKVTYLGQYSWWSRLVDGNRRIPKAAYAAAHVVRPID